MTVESTGYTGRQVKPTLPCKSFFLQRISHGPSINVVVACVFVEVRSSHYWKKLEVQAGSPLWPPLNYENISKQSQQR